MRCVAAASQGGPVSVKRSRHTCYASEREEIGRLIEVRVIHRHVCDVRRILIDLCITAVAIIDPVPGLERGIHVRPVVLRSAYRKIRVRRVKGDALELCRAESRKILAGPGESAVC